MNLSIIIPVFKVEKYIRHCIESCLNQDVSKQVYEIIAVNDGSPDNCLDILNELCKSVENMRVISQANSGLSIARNTGLSIAKGEYVWFVDSDDSISENCLGKIIARLKNNLDILQIQYRYVFENGQSSQTPNFSSIDGIKSGKDVLKAGGVAIPAQFSIYRRQFLLENNLDFYPNIYHEDVDFKPRAILAAKKVASLDDVVYDYLQREGSITSKKGLKHVRDLFIVSERLYSVSILKENYDVLSYFATVISCNINWILIIIDNLNDSEKEYAYNELYHRKHLIRTMKKSSEMRYRLEGILLDFNVKIGRLLYLKLR